MLDMVVLLFELWVWIFKKNNYKTKMSWNVCIKHFYGSYVLRLAQYSEVKYREFPSPGIGLGWGATIGVFFSS